MDKKELFDALDDFSQQLLVTLADVEAIKKNLKSLVEENTALRLENSKLRERLENSKLRERLGEVEADAPVKAKHVRESVRRIYRDGFHVCNDFYGQRREQDEECMFCDELLYRE
ncbi:TPA: initiation-control protein YabA [Streptococcus pneumoniae]|nr:initiation-control protein YabA [Streptococcus pneumoniae]